MDKGRTIIYKMQSEMAAFIIHNRYLYRKKDMNNDINWTQVRIDASINIMNAILSSSIMVFIFQFIFKRQIADIAVSYADKLIEELKNK